MNQTINEKLLSHLNLLEHNMCLLSQNKNECNNTIEYCANRLIEITKEKVALVLYIQDLENEIKSLKIALKRDRRNSI